MDQVREHNARVAKENRIIADSGYVLDETAKEKLAGVEREAELHNQILDECRKRGWIALHGSMAHRSRRTVGEEDFIIRADHGRVFWIEAKAKAGKLSTAQLGMHMHAERLGHKTHIVRSFEEFLALL
jgi:hypothetical protein